MAQLWPLFKGVVEDVWSKYGPFAALLILFLIYHEWKMNKHWTDRLGDKDKEIQRLVDERNRLQDAILSERLTSEENKNVKPS